MIVLATFGFIVAALDILNTDETAAIRFHSNTAKPVLF